MIDPSEDSEFFDLGKLEMAIAERDAAREVSRTAEALVAAWAERELMILAHLYKDSPLKVANLCDNTLDRSGALLGRVRERARSSHVVGSLKP